MIVVADTSPINYLILIEAIDLLPKLYGRVIIPSYVELELKHPSGEPPVIEWISSRPEWLEVRMLHKSTQIPQSSILHPGEREAIALALELNAELLLMDDRRGRAQAEAEGLTVTGTLGVLVRASAAGMIDLHHALADLQNTTFRISQEAMAAALKHQA